MNANTPHPHLDPAVVREGLEIIHRHAAAALAGVERPGYLQLVRIHPVDEKVISTPFMLGDVDGMTAQAVADAQAGFNVYLETRTVNEANYGRGRGKAADTRAVFAFVVDSDADKGKSCHVAAEPSITVESSPGNAHYWFFLERAISAEEARPIGEAIRTATDSGTGNVTQPFRVPGTPNFPGPAKQARGRVVSPTRILSVSGTLWTPERVREAFPARQEQQRNGKTSGGPGTGWFTVEPILAEIATPNMDRSARFHAAVSAAVLAGMSADEFEHLARRHPHGCASKYLGHLDRLREEIERSWHKIEEASEDELSRLNERFCVVRDGGRTRVLTFEKIAQKQHRRDVPTVLTFEDFRNFLCNRTVRIGDRDVPLGIWWLKHRDRRQYEGITFQPGQGQVVDGRLNLWRGWGIEPHPGDWSLLRRHIEEVLAGGNPEAADYIIRWIAWAFQNPAERAEVALVLLGKRGTGKGTLGNALCRIFGQHGTHISSAEHLAGHFNGHLRDACLLFADEAYWPGDKGAEGSLKRLITEPDLFIEAKGRDGITVPNMLHVVMASNEDWAVPAGEEERRFAVFEVSDCRKQSAAWFQALYAEMEGGGLAAMLRDLLAFDLGDWHPRRIPKTGALLKQQARSLSPEDEFWLELLESGSLPACDPDNPDRCVSGEYVTRTEGFSGSRETKHHGLFRHARESSPRLRGKSDAFLGRYLRSQGCERRRVLRERGWKFPPLKAARATWELRFPGWPWQSPELEEWQSDAS